MLKLAKENCLLPVAIKVRGNNSVLGKMLKFWEMSPKRKVYE